LNSNPEILDKYFHHKLDGSIVSALKNDFENSIVRESENLSKYIIDKYSIDLTTDYVGIKLPHPFGKAAGQLSMSGKHVLSDRMNGLAFTVLKSAVGVTMSGDLGISDWALPAPKMRLNRRIARDGREGWTVVWRGRAWTKSFDAYLELYRESLSQNPGYVVIPSLIFDITNPDRAIKQGLYCIPKLYEVYLKISPAFQFLMEVDISPTLFFLPDSNDPDKVMNWVLTSVRAAKEGLPEGVKCVVKLTNADRGAEYQLEMAQKALEVGGNKVSGLLIGNRLFDHNGEFEGKKGIAYGGFDLSNANLATLDLIKKAGIDIPLVATGNIHSGKMMCEYAIRGCLSGEMHTFFQLPSNAYRTPVKGLPRQWVALKELMFHPDDGLLAVMLKLERSGLLERRDGVLRFSDMPLIYRKMFPL
jgi:hypothetical protein